MDQGYLSCLRKGTKNNPGPETVMKLGLALVHCSEKITLIDIQKKCPTRLGGLFALTEAWGYLISCSF